MASNSFGQIFRITTFGESHGKAMGVIIDGCPSGLSITKEEIQADLAFRSPGKTPFVSPRKEQDLVTILSGVFQEKTTGAPLCLLIENHGADSSAYEATKQILKPGHAHFTYLEKYGNFDYRGGGRSSGRETAARVAAGSIARKLLKNYNIFTCAFIEKIDKYQATIPDFPIEQLKQVTYENPIYCPDEASSKHMIEAILETQRQGDSIGGIVGFKTSLLPTGLGDPVYLKLDACLAFAMMSIPASKGFEIGEGFSSSEMSGSAHNDPFIHREKTQPLSNHAGGVLGGISSGLPLYGKVAFKPTSSIRKTQTSVTTEGIPADFTLSPNAKHDPCIAIRAVPVVDAMMCLVLIDALLMQKTTRL